MITAYQKSIILSSHALFWQVFLIQILWEAAQVYSSVASADMVHLDHLQQFWGEMAQLFWVSMDYWCTVTGYHRPRWAIIEWKKKKGNSLSSCPACSATAASHCSTIARAEGHRCCRETGKRFSNQWRKVINIKYLHQYSCTLNWINVSSPKAFRTSVTNGCKNIF